MSKKLLLAPVKFGQKLSLGHQLGLPDPLDKVLFGGKGKPVPPTLTMPLPDDEAVAMARRRSIADQRRRGGRQSTILTDRDTLG